MVSEAELRRNLVATFGANWRKDHLWQGYESIKETLGLKEPFFYSPDEYQRRIQILHQIILSPVDDEPAMESGTGSTPDEHAGKQGV